MQGEHAVTQIGRRSLDLDGWGELSVWGWDDQAGSLFAQLWRDRPDDEENDLDGERPDVWITPPGWEATDQPVVLAQRISEATGIPTAAILGAMAEPVLPS